MLRWKTDRSRRQQAADIEAEDTIQLPSRDTERSEKGRDEEKEQVSQGRELCREAQGALAPAH